MGSRQDGTHMVLASSDVKRLFTSNLGSATVCILDRGARPGRPSSASAT